MVSEKKVQRTSNTIAQFLSFFSLPAIWRKTLNGVSRVFQNIA